MIFNDITELIGNTPIVKYNNRILLKLEFFNPSSSIKDRASLYMLKKAKEEGLINTDTTVIEPTSGNTGIGLAMCCAAMGLKIIVVMPVNMTEERKKMIKAYGAELVLTPAAEGMQGAVEKAEELHKSIKNSFIPMQFSNPNNTLAHIEGTSQEIWEQTGGNVDIFTAGIGSGGTATGVAIGLKKLNPDIKVYGVEPAESPLITKGTAGAHKIQGIGANFVPELFDKNVIDGVITVKGDLAIQEARELARTKGILGGISAGANLAAAKELSKRNPDKTIVTVIPDFGERYLSGELFQCSKKLKTLPRGQLNV